MLISKDRLNYMDKTEHYTATKTNADGLYKIIRKTTMQLEAWVKQDSTCLASMKP
jgi:hypothetical protein